MTRSIRILMFLAATQAMLLFVTWGPPADMMAPASRPPLLPYSITDLDRIIIGDAFDNEAVLQQRGAQWVLPSLENLPADAERIERLLLSIASADRWPIATTSAARQRYQVADYYFQRRIQLGRDDDALANVLLGTSPGFRKVHARNEAQDAVYAIRFDVFDAPATPGGWLDRSLLQLRAPVAIHGDSYSLVFEGSAWRSALGDALDQDTLTALLTTLREIQVLDAANGDIQRELASMDAATELEVSALGGETQLALFEFEGKHYIYSSRYPLFFEITSDDFKRLAVTDFTPLPAEPLTR